MGVEEDAIELGKPALVDDLSAKDLVDVGQYVESRQVVDARHDDPKDIGASHQSQISICGNESGRAALRDLLEKQGSRSANAINTEEHIVRKTLVATVAGCASACKTAQMHNLASFNAYK